VKKIIVHECYLIVSEDFIIVVDVVVGFPGRKSGPSFCRKPLLLSVASATECIEVHGRFRQSLDN
jgi:hypothetical protein